MLPFFALLILSTTVLVWLQPAGSGFFGVFLAVSVAPMRLLAELEAGRNAVAQAAVLAERARLAREMHDVLAHSLSGLALQLAGARLLARQRGADPEISDAIERAELLGGKLVAGQTATGFRVELWVPA